MNANCFKTVFSEHLDCLVAVGEHASSQGKSSGESAFGEGLAAAKASVGVFIGALVLSLAWVSLAWAQPAANALPMAGQVVQGAASMVQSANQLNITQASQRAAINWQSFDIGAAAKVNVIQPNAQAVLLNRVVGQSPSQILGQLQANGHVILVNPNGVLFGKDGSVNASSFTASTLGISDADFMAGNMLYQRNGSTAGVVNQGTIAVTPGGYVALLGASVSNEGKIIAPQGGVSSKGGVALGAAETIKVPVSGSGRIKLALTAGDINASVRNTGQIVSEGGQVYMQALALNRAAAQVIQSGSIDTTGEQGGAVHLLADGGTVKVDGSIKANSTGTDDKGLVRRGGDIVIGRDLETGVLAAATDVSGAKLESSKGFVETSGDWLATYGTRVVAKDWLLDPTNITIAASGASGTAYSSNYTAGADSVILASDISGSLTAGTSVTIATSASGTSAGHIAVDESIAKTGGGDATLTLQAHGNITVAASKTITSNTGKLNVVLNSDSDGISGGGITFNSGSGITSNGGNITLGGGTALNGTGFAIADGVSTLRGIHLESATISAGGGNIAMNGQTAVTNYAGSLSNVTGIYMAGSAVSTTGSGTIQITGKNQNTDTQSKGLELASGTITGGTTGAVTIVGDSRGVASSTFTYIRGALINGTVASTGGNVSVTGYGGAGVQFDYGVDIGGSVTATGSGTVSLSGTAGAGGSGGNVGVNTSGAGTISSVDGAISITGTGGIGDGAQIRDHGVQIGGSNAIRSTGTGSITVTGTATNSDNGFSQGVAMNSGGLSTNSGNIKIDATVPQNYQVAAYINAPIASTSGNVYIRSAGANIQNTTTGTVSGNNVSIDNTGGTIDANGVITKGTGGASTWAGVVEQNGVGISGSVTAANNLNIYGNQTGSAKGVSIAGATTTVSGKNITLYGNSSSGNGVLLSGATLQGQYINATGATNTGTAGFAWQGGNINTTGTAGTNTASVVKGISAATGNTNGFGAFMMIASSATKAASGTSLTFAGEATNLAAGVNTNERGILVQGGFSLTASGDITLDGSSKSSEGIAFGSTINMATVAGVTNKLTVKGTAAASSNNGWNAINFSGAINGNASTSSINFMGDAKNLSGANKDNAVNIAGAIAGSTANVNIQSTGGTIVTSAAITGANISIDNTNGTINSGTGVITTSTGTAGSATGISIGGNVTATGNLNLSGVSAGGTGINVVGSKTISGANIQASGKTTNGAYGVLFNGSNTVTTTGTSGDSVIKGMTTAGGANALFAWGGFSLTSATGTTLTLWGDGTSTSDRAARFDGGGTTTGAVTLKGTSTNATALMLINGAVTANANSALSLSGATNGSGQMGVYFVNAGGVALNNGATLNITGQNTNAAGVGTGVLIGGGGIVKAAGATSAGAVTITGSTSSASGSTGVSTPSSITTDGNIDIQGTVASSSNTGVNIGGAVTGAGAATTIAIGSNYAVTNAGAISISGATGTGGNINFSSTNAGISGAGTLGTTTNKNASVTFTQAGTSIYDGAINAANFTKAGTGALTLDSWALATPVATNVFNAYTVKGGGSLSLSTTPVSVATYAQLNPVSVNVENASTFSVVSSSLGYWSNTAFNFTGGSGGGTMNLGGNPVGANATTNTFSTSGGATNTITGLLNANNANVNFNLTSATSGVTMVDGSFAAIAFTQNTQDGYGLQNAGTVTVAGGGSLLFKDKLRATTLNINAGAVQMGDGSAATTAATADLEVTNVAIAAGTKLIFNRAEAYSNASVITGAGSLIQAGAGAVTLTGNSSAFAGATTVNAGKTLAMGTGGSLGAAGSTLNLASNTSNLSFTNTSGTSIVGSTIGGAGTVTENGVGGIGVLTADNTYTGTTTVSGGTLQVGNAGTTGTLGTGDVTLSNNAHLSYVRAASTTIANNIAGTGSVSASITGASSDLTVDHTIGLTGGTVNLVTDGHLSVTQTISTTNATASAVFLEAGKATAAGTASGGDVTLSGSGAVTVGTGGRITYMTGSVSGSTGLGVVAGNSRYNSDETTTRYTAALGSGAYAIYREKPVITVQVSDVTKTYDGVAYSGGALNTTLALGSLVNGDTLSAVAGNVVYGGAAQGAINHSTYTLTASDTGGLNALGYGVTYANGRLVVNKKDVTLASITAANKTYDGSDAANITSGVISTLVGTETLLVSGSGTFASKNAADGKTVTVTDVTALTKTNGTGDWGNYNLTTSGAMTTTANIAKKGVSLTSITAANKVYDGSDAATITAGSISTGVGMETLLISGSGTFASKNAADGKTVTVTDVTALTKTNGTGNWNNYYLTTTGAKTTTATISKATLTAALTGTLEKVYDGTTAAANLVNANFAVTGWAAGESATVSQTTASYGSKNVSDNSGTGVVSAVLSPSHFSAASGTLLDNYDLPTTASGNVGKITPAALTVKVNDSAVFVTLNASQAVDNGLSYTGFVNGETAVTALTGVGTRTYLPTNLTPVADTYTGAFGLSSTPTALNGNYTVTVQKGTLTVVPADKLLIGIASKAETYGVLTAANAGGSASTVTAQYCLTSDCANNLVNLSVTQLSDGRWQATDATNTSVTFSTLIDSAGHLSSGGFVNVGNYTYGASATSPTALNFNGRVVNGGVLTIQPKAAFLDAPGVSKTYDGNSVLVGGSLNITNALAGDAVAAASSGGSFVGKNAGPQGFTLSGLYLSGDDRGNYSVNNTLSGTGSITPKTLSLSAQASNKTYDGSTAATVNWTGLTGLVGSEQLGLSALGLFASADVGNDKPVNVTFSLSSGANGGLASNYVLAPQTLMASILKKEEAVPVDPVRPGRIEPSRRPVQPENWPQTSRLKPTAVIYQTSPVASSGQPAQGKSVDGLCADALTDSCVCQESPLAGLLICYVPRDAVDKDLDKNTKYTEVVRR